MRWRVAATFPPTGNQYARGTIVNNGANGNFAEVELHLRASLDTSTGDPKLYEVFLSMYGQYFTVARWNPGHTFTIIGDFGPTAPSATGDVFDAQIVGNIITVRLRGVVVGTVDVSNPSIHNTVDANNQQISTTWDGVVYPAGAPGVGFDTDGANDGAGFTDFEAGTL